MFAKVKLSQFKNRWFLIVNLLFISLLDILFIDFNETIGHFLKSVIKNLQLNVHFSGSLAESFQTLTGYLDFKNAVVHSFLKFINLISFFFYKGMFKIALFLLWLCVVWIYAKVIVKTLF